MIGFICPWCGAENGSAMPEGRETTNCRACGKIVPSSEGLQKLKDKEFEKLNLEYDELENEKWNIERRMEKIEDEISEIEQASFDRPKVRVVASDQRVLVAKN